MSRAKNGALLLKRCADARTRFATLDLALQKATRIGDDTPEMHAEWREALDALNAVVAEMESYAAGVPLHV